MAFGRIIDEWLEFKKLMTKCIKKILISEKYTGSVIQQKTFIEDYFSSKQKKNTEQQDCYLIKNSHEAIVSLGNFERVQDTQA